VHQEACLHLHRTLQTIHDLGCETGVALNPATTWHAVEEVLELADVVQVMTVNPGFGGQTFLSSQLHKIETLQRAITTRQLQTRIAVDGGIDTQTAPLVVAAGATILVAGSSIYNHEASVQACLQALQHVVRQFEK